MFSACLIDSVSIYAEVEEKYILKKLISLYKLDIFILSVNLIYFIMIKLYLFLLLFILLFSCSPKSDSGSGESNNSSTSNTLNTIGNTKIENIILQ